MLPLCASATSLLNNVVLQQNLVKLSAGKLLVDHRHDVVLQRAGVGRIAEKGLVLVHQVVINLVAQHHFFQPRGGAGNARTAGALFMRTKGLPMTW